MRGTVVKDLNFLVESLGISELRPTRPANGGITKSGLCSYIGEIDRKFVKVWSCFNERQADLIEYVSSLQFDCSFPPIIARQGSVLVQSWIQGLTIDAVEVKHRKNCAERTYKFMLQCKQTSVCGFEDSFDYLAYLVNRVQDCGILEANSLIETWSKRLTSGPLLLCHNDLSMANIVYHEESDTPYIIDNEMLSVTSGWFLAWKNSFLGTTEISSVPFYEHIEPDLVEDAWLLRKFGSKVISGHRDGAIKLLGQR